MTFREYWNYDTTSKAAKIKAFYFAPVTICFLMSLTICVFVGLASGVAPDGDPPAYLVQMINPLRFWAAFGSILAISFLLWAIYPFFGQWIDKRYPN